MGERIDQGPAGTLQPASRLMAVSTGGESARRPHDLVGTGHLIMARELKLESHKA